MKSTNTTRNLKNRYPPTPNKSIKVPIILRNKTQSFTSDKNLTTPFKDKNPTYSIDGTIIGTVIPRKIDKSIK